MAVIYYSNEIYNGYIGQGEISHGVFLGGIITDDGAVYDFFNKSHHVNESGNSYLYEISRDLSNDFHTGIFNESLIDDQHQDVGIRSYLYSNKIIDLCTDNPYSFLAAASDLAEHISNHENPGFYGLNVDQIIDYLDLGGRIRFAILFPMYYFDLLRSNNKSNIDVLDLWGTAIGIAINDYHEQWGSQNNYILPQDYEPGHIEYVSYAYNLPGLVYECCKQCEGKYKIFSYNNFDQYGSHTFLTNELKLILQGIHSAWNHLIQSSSVCSFLGNLAYDSRNLPGWFNDQSNNDPRYVRGAGAYVDGDFENISGSNLNKVRRSLYWWNFTYPDNNGLTDYTQPINIDYSNETIYANQFPVFVTLLNDEIPGEFDGYEEKTVIINWDDTNGSAHRPQEVYLDFYINDNGTPIFYNTFVMHQESDRIDHEHWTHVFELPGTYNGSVCQWLIQEKEIPFRDSDNNPVYNGNPCYSISYTSYLTISGLIYGVFSQNTSIIENVKTSYFLNQNIDITIEKEWKYAGDCFTCKDNSTYIIEFFENEFYLNFANHPYDYDSIQVDDDIISDSLFSCKQIYGPKGSNYTLDISDDFRHIKIINYCQCAERYPLDSSGVGNIFYFEVDPECWEACQNNDIRGFGVSGHWNTSERPLVYKICYLPVNFVDFAHDSHGYEDWLYDTKNCWKLYVPGGNEVYNDEIIASDHAPDISVSKYKKPKSNLDNEIIIPYWDIFFTKNVLKARIYIGTLEQHHTAFTNDGFKLSTWKIVDDVWTRCSTQESPGFESIPIRCGGYINSLYGIVEDGRDIFNDESNIQFGDPVNQLDGWVNWVEPNWSALTFKIDEDIKPTPKYSLSQPYEIYSLGGSDLIRKYLHNSDIAWMRYEFNDSWSNNHGFWYVLTDDDHMRRTNISLYGRLFEDNKNLVDAGMLIIPGAYNDLMYYRTFANTGLCNDVGGLMSKVSGTWWPKFNIYNKPNGAVAPFMGMYKYCKYLKNIDGSIFLEDTSTINNQRFGLNYFDGMFQGCTGLNDMSNLMLSFESGIPHGVCHDMFKYTDLSDFEGENLLYKADDNKNDNMGNHAFHGMFSFSGLQTPQLFDPAKISPFKCASMYENCMYLSFNNNLASLNATTIFEGGCWKMLKGCPLYYATLEATSYARWSFGKMFYNSHYLREISTKFQTWNPKNGDSEYLNVRFGNYQWVKGAGDWVSSGTPQQYDKNSWHLPRIYGVNRIPVGWSINANPW